MKSLECISAIVTTIAVYLLSDQQYIPGWSLNALGDILWIWWAVLKSAYYLVALQAILLVIALNGLNNAL